MAAGAILGGVNSSMGCFLVYQRDGFNTGVESFAEMRAEKAELKVWEKAEKTGNNESGDNESSVASIAMPVIPLLPTIPMMPTFDDAETELVPAMPAFENISALSASAKNITHENPTPVELTVKDQTLVFDGAIGSKKEPLYVFFTASSLEIDTQGKEHIQMLANWMQANPDVEIELVGHSDNSGTASYNLQLSLQRSEEVMQMLVESGVEEFRILMDYRGSEQPAVENNTDENRDLNRRVEVTWH